VHLTHLWLCQQLCILFVNTSAIFAFALVVGVGHCCWQCLCYAPGRLALNQKAPARFCADWAAAPAGVQWLQWLEVVALACECSILKFDCKGASRQLFGRWRSTQLEHSIVSSGAWLRPVMSTTTVPPC
jgi:hypothetical protein